MSFKMYNDALPISPQSIDEALQHATDSIYKGWILMCDESSLAKPLYSSHTERYLHFETIRWVPKYAVASRGDKIVYLFNHEPSTAEVSCLFARHANGPVARSSTSSNLSSSTTAIARKSAAMVDSYRLDNSVKLASFIGYWHNKAPRYEETVIKSELNQAAAAAASDRHHHPSNSQQTKDLDSHHDKDSLSSFPSNSNGHHHDNSTANSTVSSSNSTFRFAGLFFKKDKSDKVKHSSLKRAKSGIQLERKKTGDSTTNSSSATTPTTTDAAAAALLGSSVDSPQPKYYHCKIENRQSLPSPMRPSRSHESLASPLKTNAPPFLSSNAAANGRTSKKGHKNSHDDPNHHDHQHHDSVSWSNSIIKLSLSAAGQSKVQNPRLIGQSQVHSVHTSLLSEENCFEITCLRSNVKLVTDTSLPDEMPSSNYNYENNETFEDGTGGFVDDYDPDHDTGDYVDDHHHSSHHKKQPLKSTERKSSASHRPRRKSRRDQSTNSYQTNASQLVSESQASYGSCYFMCRSTEEREKWLQCLSSICKPNQLNEQHQENSLQLWLLEAKGQQLSSKPNKKYMCEIVLNKHVLARTCSKEKKDMLFWGENIELSSVSGDFVRIELYQETVETIKKKNKQRDHLHSTSSSASGREAAGKDGASSTASSLAALVIGNKTLVRSTKQLLLGYVNIPVSTIDANQPVEKWYCLEAPTSASNYDLSSGAAAASGVSGLIAANHINTSNMNLNAVDSPPNNNNSTSNAGSFTNSSASLTTTQGFSKSAISIRIKAKFQSIDILPIHCYDRFVNYLTHNYMHLMQTLEPHLTVRLKDDLASVFVRVAHKLRVQVRFLVDLIGSEVLGLADNSLTFRGNSLATKSIESYMKLVGENYLKQTLSDCIRSIIDTTNDLEIDPSKVANQSHLLANREELVQVLHLVCGRVLNSCVNFPVEMKFVFAKLRELCRRHGKSEEMCDTLISASIFLRFICPAILSPNLFNLTQEYPQEKAARKLTLAAKTLQTIANFSKFGAKEFYMSFDKMNHFVDEHTVLMREFLRNISTLGEQDLASLDESTQYLKGELDNDIDIDAESDYDGLNRAKTAGSQRYVAMDHIKSQLANMNGSGGELKFTAEFIDLGKQLSVLHKLLNNIFDKLDDPVRHKFEELLAILGELEHMKANPSAAAPVSMATTHAPPTNGDPKNRVLSYENRLHFASSVNKTPAAEQNSTGSASSVASLTPPLQLASSIQSVLLKNELMTPNSSLKSDSSNSELGEGAGKSSQYSSQLILNINPGNDKSAISAARLINNATNVHQKLETEINALKQRLRETEQSLKKEQTEKYLIEYKLKQQQQDNDLQMKNIINRLIKVEEELRKEQSEMHKILKAKQDLIEIQKKRIEFLSGRVMNTTTPSTGGKIEKQASAVNGSTNSLNGSGLSNSHPSSGYNQHVYLKSKTRVDTESSQSVSPLAKTSDEKQASPADSSSSANSPSHASSSADSTTGAVVANPTVFKPQLIAASPSSSSSSMTQFCSYLASNSSLMMQPPQDTVRQPPANLRKLLNNSNSSSSSSSSQERQSIKACESAPIGGVTSAASTASSSVGGMATSTSSHQLSQYTHFLRTSEL